MLSCLLMLAPFAQAADGPSQVRIVESEGTYRLFVDGQPFFIKGGGGSGHLDELAARGGNAVRTWRVDSDPAQMRAFLDNAQRLGLKVAVGIEVGNERHGFNYDDDAAVAAQLARIRGEVEAWKDHPAVLMWVAGNELNLHYTNQKVWNAIGGIADMIHAIDPNHPVMTTLAGFGPPLIEQIKQRAGSLDLIGIQLYGNLGELPDKLRESHWTGPYVVTEWGPTGHWESPLTAWGAPIEDDASRKAGVLLDRYQRYIAGEHRQGLGSFVFLWGQKQERTPTWYGLFLAEGESTPSVDAMQYAWTGQWPDNRAPAIAPIRVDGKLASHSVVLKAGSRHRAHVQASDRDGDPLAYRWTLREESTATSIGGDPEHLPAAVDAAVQPGAPGQVTLVAPAKAGRYRLFVEVRDGQGHAAYANFPLQVE
ncbi:glycoside hydrolase family 2 TIM barrel-domain containing protein [Stenotrophomonas sp. HITSZ_GD]|uniref:glycoside hydrolase family 2 TIM barrel-domain containing protein n=1 Tax=Stenotrophomonas sp. HITSZ_GD TaxID=3037248 RepID=UPI00240E222A|nr:glycoside hydrolase family 2 TIM barrel-domain containing protein [Stenotrophomonas sp. HITSZ_GD]MDG2524172.1 glycoside hydrolase family 2 TIM barrel-domain containing protein [Stenotrophomonas sp. HITSZ_GD]